MLSDLDGMSMMFGKREAADGEEAQDADKRGKAGT